MSLPRMLRTAFQSRSVRHFGKLAYTPDVMAEFQTKAAPQDIGTTFERLCGLFTRKVGVPLPLALFGGSVTLQYYLGTSDDFFMGSFITAKDPDALAEFYQAEDLLKIIAIHPILFNLFMNKVDPQEESAQLLKPIGLDEETGFKVKYFGMEVAFQLETEEEDDQITSFKRRERFIDWIPILDELGRKVLLWDQTWTYGFRKLENGTTEVYHHGEKFIGPWPVRLIVFFHQYYVLWGCQKHINSEAFGNEDLMDEAHEQMACIPLHVMKEMVASARASAMQRLKELTETNAPRDRAKIKRTATTIKHLDQLAARDRGVAVVVRAKAPGSTGGETGVKFIAKDEATQAALSSFMEQKGNDTDVLQKILTNPELQFKPRAKKNKKLEAAVQTMPYAAPKNSVIEVVSAGAQPA